MTILSWPAAVPAPNDFSLGPIANTQSGGRSPFDGTEQTLELPGGRWMAELRFRHLDIAEWRALSAFVASLGGRAGRFTWSPVARFPRRATATGTPLVKGANQTGKALITDGWGTGTAFLVGDFFGYNDSSGRSMMHQVTNDAAITAGEVTLAFWPSIRRSPADNAAINLTTFSPVWRLSRDDAMMDYEPGDRGFALTLGLEEAIW